ncbi:MAG: alanine:cation symporter family protein [Candidatus Aminicenantes bacterium]|nr:alanine:cation symporter family protein [Candidatus Aminicenantes bacterium]MDH5383509.1 alanine:cation symporter family protein [Candidatus Aminicenantes bacterium]
MDFFDQAIRFVASLVWGPQTVALLLGVGLLLTIWLRFVQIRRLRLSFRLVAGPRDFGESQKERKGDISPFQALTTSLACVIGNGNIAGVCTAIAMGGPGSVFWMWLGALVGMATKLVEAVLGQRFKRIMPDGSVAGGPMYYIREGLGLPWLAGIYAFFMGCKPLFSTSTIQSNSIALALKTQLGLEPWISGLGLALLTWLVIIGGIKSIARVTEFLSPFMVILYIMGALVIVVLFASELPHAFSLIIVGAFKPSAITGGVAGMTVARAIRYGFARGAYSNEAGSGTAAVFHATAQTSEPVRQGLIASLDVFIDTIIICTLTALTVLVTGVWTEGTSTEMTTAAFNAAIPNIGGLIVAASSFLFGYSSLIAVTYYGEISFSYLLGLWIKKPFRWIFCLVILIGAVLEVEVAWSIGDVFNGMMVFTNLIGILGLSAVAVKAVNTYLKEMDKKGDVPRTG